MIYRPAGAVYHYYSEVNMGEERRKYPRLSLNQCIKISYGKETFIDAEAVNISQNGILCSTASSVGQLERIYMMIDLPSGSETRTIECEGIAMHTQTAEGKTFFGIQFIDMKESDSAALRQYLSETQQ